MTLLKNESNEFNAPFEPSQIKMDSKVQSIYSLMSRIKHGEIKTPPYQRREVWNNIAKSRLIESILVRIPIPVFYIDASDENCWKIIDGLQRITALKEFMNEKTLKLENLEYVSDLNGCYFDDLPRSYQRRIEETDVTVIFINAGTPENVKFNIFKRINTGGLPLSEQEIRHALNNGSSSDLVKTISKKEVITKVWSIPQERMELDELILRGLGYWFLDLECIFDETLDTYIVSVMKKINNEKESIVKKRAEKYILANEVCYSIFKERAFCKITPGVNRKNPPNKNIYEAWMSVLSQASSTDLNFLMTHSGEVYSGYLELVNDDKFSKLVSSRKHNAMVSRYNYLHKFISKWISI